MKLTRKIIEIDDELCDGCGQCVPSCAEGAIRIVDGKARLLAEKYCDGLGACLGECPRGAMTIVEREADDFDEEAVEQHLLEKVEPPLPAAETLACGCPSTLIQTFVPMASGPAPKEGPGGESSDSALSHWPVQIRLVPSTAPFLKNADLLVTADCVPVAYPRFHRDFLKGKAIMLGCPKFDDVQGYVEKFTDIFRDAGIRSVTVLDMEVPCCSALPRIIKTAMEAAGKRVPLREIVISSRGEVLKREDLAA
jgi:Pyruvate/2-oxoacid:ferredoxin oxidoreductase delta subunit